MIYIHIPFCRSFCTYCSFYSEVAARCRKSEDVEFSEFSNALCREISCRRDEISDKVNTLYIGGGTPSVLPLSVFSQVMSALDDAGYGNPYDEFTVEVNPEDIVQKGEAYVEGLLRLGVNRISMGVQSFDDNVLKFMNRRHDSLKARKAYAVLENAGVSNISIDLIFGLPQLSDTQWKETLEKALDISPSGRLPQHVSSYQLSVEPDSMLEKLLDNGRWTEASDEQCERQYDMLCSALSASGYRHYEISNFALPGFEAKHNSAYWKHVPYVGFGPGAHSFASGGDILNCRQAAVGPIRRWNRGDLKGYLENPTGVWESEVLSDEQIALEKIMLALRTSDGIQESFLRLHCNPRNLERALASGHLVPAGGPLGSDGIRLRIPESRFFISDSIITDIL